ncbi:hypothetical protein BRADI_1g14343v3 [Brachypodium distachyon]|uniref:Uncharacterized protein n=1 Tax=Brachypodium distachyon TaxID=15368 RepID=A0A0Q3RME3_BRADI|nr:hypothetical protein BRADI_1g14343v3 [Brachypodium distachyon]
MEKRRVPAGIEEMLGGWLDDFYSKIKRLMVCGGAAVIWTIWKCRNEACFQQKFPHDPAGLIFRVCTLLDAWNSLQKDRDRGKLEEGSKKLRMVMHEVYSKRHGWLHDVRRLGI